MKGKDTMRRCGIFYDAEFTSVHSLLDAAVKFLRGPETDDGVDDGGRVDRRAAIDYGDEDGVLLAVVAKKKMEELESKCKQPIGGFRL